MGPSLGMLIICLIIGTFLLCVAIGVGFLLNRILPAVDLGIGILIGLVTIGVTIHLLLGLMESLKAGEDEYEEVDEETKPRYLIYPRRSFSRRQSRKKQ